MDGDTTFGAWLKSRRRQLDLTQKGLAHQVGCSVGTIRKMEADERRPSRQLAGLLGECLKIPHDQREVFIAFARSEAYISDFPLPVLPAADDQIPIIPQESKKPSIKHNLLLAATPFVGREGELAALEALFCDQGMRLVTIVGPGGIGKTRLVLAYASQWVNQDEYETNPYKDGVFFVDLVPLTETERLVFGIAETLNLSIQVGAREKRSPKHQLLDYLQDRRMLLVLDNFEHLLSPSQIYQDGADCAALVADILRAAPDAHILVTSRERLNLQEEQVFAIDGLTFPDRSPGAPVAGLDDVCGYSAVQLFVQAARRNLQDFNLETDNKRLGLMQICQMVDGMPLALELAAAWVDVLSLADIAAEIQQNLDFLESDMRNAPDRHRSMRATFDYSWQILNEKEKLIFSQLTVFRDGFTRDAAQAVTGATLRQLSRLANKSFIQFNQQRNRYQVHGLLRQYGAERLSQDPELRSNLQDRHSSYYCQLLANYTEDLKGAGQPQALVAIEADIENMRMAWDHAISQQDLAALEISLESLHRFFYNYSRYTQGVKEFEKAEAVLRFGQPVGKRGIVLGRTLAFLGRFYITTGKPSKALDTLNESLDLFQQLGLQEQRLIPLLFLAELQGSFEESISMYKEGLAIAREIGDQWAIGHALIYMSIYHLSAGYYELAEQQGREALAAFSLTGDVGGKQVTFSQLSEIAICRGQYQEALSLARECMAFSQEFNPNYPLSGCNSLARALYAVGSYREANELFHQVLAFQREMDDTCITGTHFGLGKLALNTGDYTRAERYFHESLSTALDAENPIIVAQNYDTLGRLALVQCDCIQAGEHLLGALQTAIQLCRPPLLLSIFATSAELFAKENNLEHAALLAFFVTNHSASQAKVKERAELLLTRLEEQLNPDDLAEIRRRSQECKLDCLAMQLLNDLKGD